MEGFLVQGWVLIYLLPSGFCTQAGAPTGVSANERRWFIMPPTTWGFHAGGCVFRPEYSHYHPRCHDVVQTRVCVFSSLRTTLSTLRDIQHIHASLYILIPLLLPSREIQAPWPQRGEWNARSPRMFHIFYTPPPPPSPQNGHKHELLLR